MTEPHRNIHSLPHKWRTELFCPHWSTGKIINHILVVKLLPFLQDPVPGPTLSPEAAHSPSWRAVPWEEAGLRVKHPGLILPSQEEPVVAQTTVKSRPEDPWEKEMVTHFSILASCLENPMDGGAQQATVHGAAVRHIPYLVLSIFVHSSLQKKTLFCPTPDQVKFYLGKYHSC